MKTFLRNFLLAATFGLSAVTAYASCSEDLCEGDRAYHIQREQDVTVVAIDRGQFVVRFDDGSYSSNWNREDIALLSGCAQDLCVGYPVMNAVLGFRAATIHAIQWGGRYAIRYDDNGSVAKNWNRTDIAVAWGCVEGLCVNDIVFTPALGENARIAGVQGNPQGTPDRLVLVTNSGQLRGNYTARELTLLQRGPTAYPPGRPCPMGTHWDPRSQSCLPDLPPPPPVCPAGTHWDPWENRCVPNAPPPPPYCPPGTHWDPRMQRCERDFPPPPPNCPWGTHWDPRSQRCIRDLPPPPPPPPTCPGGTHWDPRIQRCVSNHPNPPPPAPPQVCPSGTHWDPRQQRCVRR